MDNVTTTEEASPRPIGRIRSLVVRRLDNRVVLGLAGGIADRLGIPDAYVRAAFVSLALAGGVGIILYLLGTIITTAGDEEPNDPPEARQVIGLAIMFFGAMALFRGMNLWFGDTVVWAGTLLAFGGAAMWDKTSLFDQPPRIITGRILEHRAHACAPRLRLLALGDKCIHLRFRLIW